MISRDSELFTRLPRELEAIARSTLLVPLIDIGEETYLATSDCDWLVNLQTWVTNGAEGRSPGVVLNSQKQATLTDQPNRFAGFAKLGPAARGRLRNLIAIETCPSETARLNPEFSLIGRGEFRGDSDEQPLDDDPSMTAPFAKTAQYMGSKRRLGGLLAEAVQSVATSKTSILDLMTGSGSAAGWFAQRWETLASDAENFATVLATIHGGGFDGTQAQALARRVISSAEENYDRLESIYHNHIREEQHWLLAEPSQATLDGYAQFLEARTAHAPWPGPSEIDPVQLRKEGRVNPHREPHLLFSTSYANTYFGIQQSLEIDSLHYAISKLHDPLEKAWATGAAITTISYAGTKYAGHFAQPRRLTLSSLEHYQQHRSVPIFLEFIARLVALGRRSQAVVHNVTAVPGPWKQAVETTALRADKRPVVVYLDAPYTREEYNRYYHPLETFIRYDYPVLVGKGLVPSKADGYRFASEFFTTNSDVMAERLTAVITECLGQGWPVVWSYASTGMADPREVIESVNREVPVDLHGYGIPYSHRSQGRRKARQLQEYVFVLTPIT